MKKVSVIIPAYNEETTIAGVVTTCLKTPEVAEIIVVSDGSTDQTVNEVKKIKSKKIKIIEFPENRGKGAAIAEGVLNAKKEILLFLDADLINLQPHHLSSLIWPVINDQVDMTIADLNSSFKPTLQFISPPLLWYFSGQRCLKKKFILKYLKKIEKSQYAIEILLNEIFKNKRVVVIPFYSSKPLHLLKHKKWKDWKASYAKEVFQLAQGVIKNKSKEYQKKFNRLLIKTLASYFKTSIKKIRQFLEEE
ncbi:MAG: glycosyltransferase family 2 protein [Microgenomates group bacterium]